MLIVLGFDSLDAERVTEFETPNIDKLPQKGLLHTFSNLSPSELNTKVLWASMFSGTHPIDLFPEYYSSEYMGDPEKVFEDEVQGGWNIDVLNIELILSLERKIVQILPKRLNRFIEGQLNERGVIRKSFVEQRLDEVESILDKATAPELISIPGINWDHSNRELKQMIEPYSKIIDGTKRHIIQSDPEQFEQFAFKADIERLVRTLHTIESRRPDLLIVHFFSLDLIQHIWVENEKKMQRWYGLYDHFLNQVMHCSGENDTIVVLSDHGMQSSGIHSQNAFYGASKEIWQEDSYEMIDLADILKNELEKHRPENTNPSNFELADNTKTHLEDLGYF